MLITSRCSVCQGITESSRIFLQGNVNEYAKFCSNLDQSGGRINWHADTNVPAAASLAEGTHLMKVYSFKDEGQEKLTAASNVAPQHLHYECESATICWVNVDDVGYPHISDVSLPIGNHSPTPSSSPHISLTFYDTDMNEVSKRAGRAGRQKWAKGFIN